MNIITIYIFITIEKFIGIYYLLINKEQRTKSYLRSIMKIIDVFIVSEIVSALVVY